MIRISCYNNNQKRMLSPTLNCNHSVYIIREIIFGSGSRRIVTVRMYNDIDFTVSGHIILLPWYSSQFALFLLYYCILFYYFHSLLFLYLYLSFLDFVVIAWTLPRTAPQSTTTGAWRCLLEDKVGKWMRYILISYYIS